MPPANPTHDPNAWPKAYLLQLYDQAIAHGCVRISPLDEASAKSLTLSFYRIRRKADAASSGYIKPEFYLVTATRWTPEHGGSINLVYTKLPDDIPLPSITPISPTEIPNDIPEPTTLHTDIAASMDLDTSDIDVNDFVNSLRKEAAAKSNDAEELP